MAGSSRALILYGDLLSQPCRSVLLFCRAAGIPHQYKSVRIQGVMHLSRAYARVNKLQTLPAIDNGGFVLRDSAAILRYLARTREVEDHWYPKDPVAQARVDEYLHWHHLNTRLGCVRYMQTNWVRPMIENRPPKEGQVARWQAFMETVLDSLEAIWLEGGDRRFLASSDRITVADLQAACELEGTKLPGYDIRKERPILGAYLDRVRDEAGPGLYDEVHEFLRRLEKEFPGGRVPGRAYTIKEFFKARLGY